MIPRLQHRRFLVQYAKNLSATKIESLSSKRPLPLGAEGWGEGLARTGTTPTFFFPFSLSFAPSPWPSPRGRGNKKTAHRLFLVALFMVLWMIAGANAGKMAHYMKFW